MRSGEHMAALTDKSFKFPSNVFWVTSREADDCCWSAVLAPQHEAVREYNARVARGEAMPDGLEVFARLADLNDYWIGRPGGFFFSARRSAGPRPPPSSMPPDAPATCKTVISRHVLSGQT